MTQERYPHLFRPLRVGNIEIRNRLMQSAHAMAFNTRDGLTTNRDIEYHAARARGGIGLMITGNRLIHPTSNTFCRGYAYGYRDEMVERDRALTRAVHDHGARIFAQLNHFGVMGETHAMDDYRVLWSSSNIKSPVFGEMAKAMERQDMDEVVEGWTRSAEYAKAAGFDGVEVHLAHSYLLHQFISPLFNKRTDEYGGAFENRMRFPLEVVRAVRERVGRDFVVGVRLTLDEMVPGGLQVDDWIQVARTVEATGCIDYIMTTAGVYQSASYIMPPADVPNGWLADPAARLKQAVDLPVFAVSGITTAAEAEAILARDGADMVAMTRAQIADPDFANKTRQGRENDIYHCLRCNQGCVARLFYGTSMTCQVNPATGREERFAPHTEVPAATPGHWVVVGGGPGGMKAAEGLARRGHRVTLLEKEDRLGGQVNQMVKLPRRDSFAWITKDLGSQLEKLGVDLRLNTEADVDGVLALQPDGVIVATGSTPDRSGYSDINPLVPKIPGIDAPHVLTTVDVLEGAEVGKRVLVLDEEGNRYSAGITEYLVEKGHHVHLVTRWNALFHKLAQTLDQPVVYGKLPGDRFQATLNSWVSSFENGKVDLYQLYTGETHTLDDVDTVVLAVRHLPLEALYLDLAARHPKVHRVGDCQAPRKTDHAIFEGFLAGREEFDNWTRYVEPGALEQFDPTLPERLKVLQA